MLRGGWEITKTKQSNYIATTRDFYQHLLNRGYRQEVLTPIFQSAATIIDQRARMPVTATDVGTINPQKRQTTGGETTVSPLGIPPKGHQPAGDPTSLSSFTGTCDLPASP
jgi:hypothetical protein